jgi:hypothetical protein
MKKPLPTVNAPTLVTTLPVSGLKVTYRPFIVKEQKALLLAQQSEDEETIAATVRDVLTTCTSGTLDFDKATTADIAYFFIQLRIASVGSEVKFGIPCINCNEVVNMNMDLTSIVVDASKANKVVKITDTVGIVFRFPTLNDSFDLESTDQNERTIKMIKILIESIYDEEEVHSKDDYTDQEIEEWIMGLNENQLLRIQEFVDNIPELKHSMEFTCPHCQTKQSRLLEGLHNFFRLGDDA